MNRSAIILAGGISSRFGEDKGIVKLAGKPLLRYVVDIVYSIAEETIIVTHTIERAKQYYTLVPSNVRFVVDKCEATGPLVGSLSGFTIARGKYCMVLPFDTPFVSRELVLLLFDLCIGRSAVIPRWPNGQIEPLHAVYRVDAAKTAAEATLAVGRLDMRGMIERMRSVRFLSTLVISQVDPELRNFFNVNTPLDLKRAEAMLKHRKNK